MEIDRTHLQWRDYFIVFWHEMVPVASCSVDPETRLVCIVPNCWLPSGMLWCNFARTNLTPLALRVVIVTFRWWFETVEVILGR